MKGESFCRLKETRDISTNCIVWPYLDLNLKKKYI